MLKNYILIAWRTLWRNKLYSLVNFSSLILGLTTVMLVTLYVKDDLSFDRFHIHGTHIYRLVQDMTYPNGETNHMGNTGLPQGPAFKQEIPEVIDYCRVKNGWNTIVKKGNNGIKQNLMYVDNSFFTMFTFKSIYGDITDALKNKQEVVLSDEMAEKYFGDINPVGEILNIGDEGGELKPFKVAAVVQSPPKNSSIQFDLLLSFDHMIPSDPKEIEGAQSWFNASLNTFILLQPSYNKVSMEYKLKEIATKYTAINFNKESGNKSKSDQIKTVFHLQPFFQMHLDKKYYATNGLHYWSDAKYPKILAALGLLVLFIACINFINLTLAKSSNRTKEIGVRKTAGGSSSQLIFQFISESFIISFLAFIPSWLLTKILLPEFSAVTDKYYTSTVLFHPDSLLLFLTILIVVTLISGAYPALILSRLHPISSLKGTFKINSNTTFGKSLIVFQFAIATTLIICTAVAIKQFDYILHKDLGYTTKNIIRFWIPWDKIQSLSPILKTEIGQVPNVKNISAKSGDRNSTVMEVHGKRTDYIYYEHIDENHLQLLGIPLVSGRYFSKEFTGDTLSGMIVNESFVHKILHDKEVYTTDIKYGGHNMHIVGVVKDFHYSSLKEAIKPIVWFKDRGTQAGCIHVEMSSQDQVNTIAAIQSIYKKHEPYLPMEFDFLEDHRMQSYSEDLLWKKIFTYTAILAILIALLGLFGITSFITEQRIKEIGIRKVLGASIRDLNILLSKDFLKLILLSILIACPLGIYCMNLWLQSFVYKIHMQWWVIGMVCTSVLVLAYSVISVQTIKSSVSNPIKSLRSE